MITLEEILKNNGFIEIGKAPKDGRYILVKDELYKDFCAWRHKDKYLLGDYDTNEGYGWYTEDWCEFKNPTYFMYDDTNELLCKLIRLYDESTLESFFDILNQPGRVNAQSLITTRNSGRKMVEDFYKLEKLKNVSEVVKAVISKTERPVYPITSSDC